MDLKIKLTNFKEQVFYYLFLNCNLSLEQLQKLNIIFNQAVKEVYLYEL